MADRTSATPDPAPGVRLGLPATGRGAVASWGRRFLGLLVDWGIATLVGRAFLDGLGRETAPLVVFFVMQVLLVSTIGTSIGHAVTGIAVRRLDGRPVGFALGTARAILLLLVVPPVVYDHDRRGLHDRAAQTVVVRR
ncbi:RDD family protein [Kineococcus rhizosphaerae]|uniref:RDD family protein n=1 Tax=Kineococcus rhizosphaerae TaxID=559628 RepID=A0A2T0R8F4_9ACTN|nr:RDD family protein [Kineococcus rhizosphaerae]PRY17435.1 RDD family protein [Kineococcus rhizosphaerae]